MGSPEPPPRAPEARAREEQPPRWLYGVSLVLITWLVYRGALGNGFVQWDDPVHLIDNARLRPPSASSIAAFWTAPFEGLYVPVAYTYWSVLAWFAEGGRHGAAGDELSAFAFHLGQLGLHLACTLLVYRILELLVRRRFAAWAGALLFALHPLQVEAVAWASEARGVLAALFGLLALLLHLGPAADGKPARASAAPSRARAASALACVALACLSKPSAVVLPVAALVLDVGALRRPLARSAAQLWPWFVVSLLVGILAKRLQPDHIVLAFTAPAARPWIAADALGFYVTKLFWPVALCADHGRTPEAVFELGLAHLTWALPAVLTLALAIVPGRRIALTAWVLFASGLAPVLGLVPFGHQVYSTVADRYAYLSLTAAALAGAWLLARWRGRTATAVALIVLAALGLASARQTRYWLDSNALFEHVLAVNPGSWVAYNNLAFAHDQRYEFEWARVSYERSLAIAPANHMTFNGLGNLALRQGDVQGALAHYARVLELRPRHLKTEANLRQLEARLQTWSASAARLRAAIARRPRDAGLRADLARVTQDLGRRREAVEIYRESLSLAGRPGPAALELAWLLATAQEPDLRSGEEALALVASVHETRYTATAVFQYVQAAALAETGRVGEGIASASAALELARAEGSERLARRIEGWLALARGGVVPHGRQRLVVPEV